MTAMGSDGTEPVRIAAPPPATFGAMVRRAAADFWLNYFFLNARYAPCYTRLAKPFFLGWAWGWSQSLRDGTLANARWLLGDGSTPSQRQELARQIIGNFFDFVSDVARAGGMSLEQLQEQITSIEGREAYLRARQSGKGAIIATAHMGSFEVGMTALLQVEKRIHVVFRRDSRGAFERLRTKLRQRLGVLEAALDDGWGVWMRLRDALAANETVAMQADRVMPGQKGCRVPFMGGHVLLPVGPVKLALISGAPIIPVFSVRQPDGRVRIFIEEAIHVDAGEAREAGLQPPMRQLAAVIEKYVRTYPQQWLVLQRAWCEDLDEREGSA